jgi:hypothetical protein
MAVDVEVAMSELNLLVPVDGDSQQQLGNESQRRRKRGGRKQRKLEGVLFENRGWPEIELQSGLKKNSGIPSSKKLYVSFPYWNVSGSGSPNDRCRY